VTQPGKKGESQLDHRFYRVWLRTLGKCRS